MTSQRMKSWLRLGAFALTVQLVLLVLTVREVRARTEGALTRAGRLLIAIADSTQQAPRAIQLNGATLQLSVGSTERSVRDVLDHVQRQCRQHSGGLGRKLAEANARAGRRVSVEEHDALLDGIYRIDDGDHGVIACLDVGEERLSIDGLRARVAAFARTGDLAELGQVRFVTVERGDRRTVFAALWSEGPILLTRMFPSHGDAPGRDLVGVPRPDRSRRVLSSWEAGQPKSIQVYLVTEKALHELKRDYRKQLVDAGVSLVGSPADAAPGYVAQRGAQAWVIGFASVDESSAMVTISSLGEATHASSGR